MLMGQDHGADKQTNYIYTYYEPKERQWIA